MYRYPPVSEHVELLPLPSTTLSVTWDEPTPECIRHWISPSERNGFLIDDSSCDVPPFWDASRISMGPYIEEGTPYCRVNLRSDTDIENTGLFVRTKERYSTNIPITGEPTWIQYRFPLPEGHQARTLSYYANRGRLFGTHPDSCHPSEHDSNGDCQLTALASGEDWSDPVPAGIFMLWAEAGSCSEWVISGPHEPSADFTWSKVERYIIDVPEEVKDSEELVATMLFYHQYPGGCEGNYCDRVGAFTDWYPHLLSEKPLVSTMEPPVARPRIFGDDEEWMTEQQKFENMDCLSADWQVGSAWGNIVNIPNNWDNLTKGGEGCLGNIPTSLVDVGFANAYLDGSAASWFNVTQFAQALHSSVEEFVMAQYRNMRRFLNRKSMIWHPSDCIEMARFTLTFNSFEFDLRTRNYAGGP